MQQFKGKNDEDTTKKNAAHFSRIVGSLCGDTTPYANVSYVNPQTGSNKVVQAAVITHWWAMKKATWYNAPVIKNGATRTKVARDSLHANWWKYVAQHANDRDGSFPVFVPRGECHRSFSQGHTDINVDDISVDN